MASRLIFFLPNAKGGVATFTDTYVYALPEKNIKVIKYKITGSLFNEVSLTKEKNVEWVSVGFSKYSTPQSKFALLRKLIEIEDILICNDSFELEFINYFQIENKIVYILHGDLIHYRNILNSYQSFIDLVLCVSNGLKNKYGALFPSLKFEVSHPFLTDMPETEFLSGNKLNGIFIGKFEYQKGADLFLDILKSCEVEMNWTVIAIRNGSEADLVDRIPSHVKIYMDLPNKRVLKILSEVDVLIFPSRTEGFGIVVLEAMSCGVVPIVLNIPIGIPDQVIHGYNGFIVNPENWSEAHGFLERLASDSNLLVRMKKNATGFVRDNFNSISIAENFVTRVMTVPINNEKRFHKQGSPYMTHLPEPVYRVLKFAHNKLKYG